MKYPIFEEDEVEWNMDRKKAFTRKKLKVCYKYIIILKVSGFHSTYSNIFFMNIENLIIAVENLQFF